jgi:hypothetical protein
MFETSGAYNDAAASFDRMPLLDKEFAVLSWSRRTLRSMVLREIGKYVLPRARILPPIRRIRHSQQIESGCRRGSLAAILRVES